VADPAELLAGLIVPPPGATARPDLRLVPRAATTRFAPAPTGELHLGHLVNALYTWGVARATGGRVVLRIEDHDRGRSRPAFEAGLLDDLDRLGLRPDQPSTAELRAGPSPYRQSDDEAPYAQALDRLRDAGLVYACACSRSTFEAYAAEHGRPFEGPGCPGGCRALGLAEDPGRSLRVALGGGSEAWTDLLAGPIADDATPAGDLPVRDRHGDWTYAFCVVVDDVRHGVDLVIRGRDLLAATAPQIRLARRLGRGTPPWFLHHPLVRLTNGAKLSKADRSTSVRSLLNAGWRPADLFGAAARLAGLTRDVRPIEIGALDGPLAD
jgi:glutamyl-tRNA synthetase/glutamyl-Q tRNA(Asp) synthetase